MDRSRNAGKQLQHSRICLRLRSSILDMPCGFSFEEVATVFEMYFCISVQPPCPQHENSNVRCPSSRRPPEDSITITGRAPAFCSHQTSADHHSLILTQLPAVWWVASYRTVSASPLRFSHGLLAFECLICTTYKHGFSTWSALTFF